MAEVINEMQERLLPEYEQLKKHDICSDEQIREFIRKREKFHTKITQRTKTVRDYAEFILFEKKVHKWVTGKEHLYNTKLTSLKSSIASRIIRLYRDGVRVFPKEVRFWQNYLQFSKKSVPHEVSGIYEKMLTFHGFQQHVWCDAALWAYEYSLNMSKVKNILFRGLQRHPQSEAIHKTFFDLILERASYMNKQKELNNKTSEHDIGLEQVAIVYRNSRQQIKNIEYFLNLLERCEEEKFKNITMKLQKEIIDDLVQMFPRSEILWDALAQRELKGFNICDLEDIAPLQCDSSKSVNVDEQDKFKNSSEASTASESDHTKHEENEITEWQIRTLKCRIELCCKVYNTAVTTLNTTAMWTMYINAMLKLNQDMSTQKTLKRKCLAIAFKSGHESGLMSVDHYCTFARMLSESSDTGVVMANDLLSNAIKSKPCVQLYQVWIGIYIIINDETKVYEIFKNANLDLGVKNVLPIWRCTIQYYLTRIEDCMKRLKKLYKEASHQIYPEFGIFRAEYLDFCALNMNIEKTREEYDQLCQVPPQNLEMHMKMAEIEAHFPENARNINRWRLCYDNATYYFGKTSVLVWINLIVFERDHGNPRLMNSIYNRAKNILPDNLVDNFISKYTLLTNIEIGI